MSGAEVRLVWEFVISSRLLWAREPEWALRCLLPRQEVGQRRVAAMVAVGALLTGLMTDAAELGGAEAAEDLLAQFVAAGARLDSGALRDLLAAHGGGAGTAGVEVLIEVLVELMITFAVWERTRRWTLAP